MKVFFPPDAKNSGIEIHYVKKPKLLKISGWYDHFVGLEPTTIPLAEFFEMLGITEKDCQSAFKAKEVTK